MEVLIGLALIVGIPFLVFVSIYNKLVKLRQGVRESWSAIQTELQRRFDLIPNLVEVVKGYAQHERSTLEEVIKARNAAISAQESPESLAQANRVLSSALRDVFALSEAYPQLKANENFKELQDQLEQTETRISQARRFYNANVRELNNACEMFPSAVVARAQGFKPEVYFGLEDPDAYMPVKISGLATPSSPGDEAGSTIKLTEKQKEQG